MHCLARKGIATELLVQSCGLFAELSKRSEENVTYMKKKAVLLNPLTFLVQNRWQFARIERKSLEVEIILYTLEIGLSRKVYLPVDRRSNLRFFRLE